MRKTKIVWLLFVLLLSVSYPAYASVSAGLEWRYHTNEDKYSLDALKVDTDITENWVFQGSYDQENKDLAADFIHKSKVTSRIEPYLGFGVRDLLQESGSKLSAGERMELVAGIRLNISPNPKSGMFLSMEAKAVPNTAFHDSNPEILKPTFSLSFNYRIPPSYPLPTRKKKIKLPSNLSDNDFELLARVVTAEAGSEPFEGQIAVAAVVLNRISSGQFPDTVSGVVYQTNQFKCAPRLSAIIPTNSCYKAAMAALKGQDPSYGALYYYNPEISSPQGLAYFRSAKLKITAKIGNHIFLR